MNEERQERQINIRELIFGVCGEWRRIILITILGMIATVIVNIPLVFKYFSKLGVILVAETLIKQVIFIGIAVFVGTLIFYFFMYITSDKIKSVTNYELNSDLKLVGAIASETNKHNTVIDRFFKKCSGVKLYHKDRYEHIERIANVIEAELSIKPTKEKASIALVSVCDENVINEFEQLVCSKLADIAIFTKASSALVSADSVKKIMKSDYVLIIEKQDETTYSQFESVKKMIESWGKDIIGTVLMDVESL